MVRRDGGAVTADEERIVRFRKGGDVRWRTPTPGGRPISPTETEDGTVVLATNGGPISAYDPERGRRIGTLDLRDTIDGLEGRWDTTNTPGAHGHRIYVSTEFTLASGAPDPNRHARLYAIDVDPERPPGERLRVAWFYEFGARSGASPLVLGRTIVFDGDRERPDSPPGPRFFGIRDEGDHPRLLWQHGLEGPGVASAALDPRGGAWVFSFAKRTLWRISTETGEVMQSIDLDAIVDEPDTHVPLSALSIADGPRGRPVMILTARSASSAYVVALDPARRRLLWKHRLDGDLRTNTPMGQFPIARSRDGRLSVVFSMLAGVRGISGPAPGR
jgi:outer membrane protein assembly factor BamB